MEGLSGAEESLYIKSLFKTISFHDVHEELKKRINYTGSDSYYTMTLKLRLDILSRASCNVKLQDELKSEMNGMQLKVPSGYTCSVSGCKYNTKNYNKLLNHIKMLHSSGDLRLVCQLKGCERELSSLKMLHMHLRSSHRTRKSTVVIKQTQLAEQMIKLKCQSVTCGHQIVKTLKDLKVHLVKDHTEKKEEVQCIFAGCDFSSNKSGTLRSHFTRKHPTHMINDLKNEVTVPSDESGGNLGAIDLDVINDDSVNDEFYPECDGNETTVEEPGEDDRELDDEECCNKEVFTRALAMQFNSWMNVKNIAYTTVNSIVSEVFNSYEQGVNTTKERIRLHLSKDSWDEVKIEDLLSKVDLNDPFKEARLELEKEDKRISYIESEFEFAKPKTVRLSDAPTAVQPATMQYIPIKESLRIFLEDPTYLKQKNEDPFYHEPGVVKDVKDSENFRSNKFFQDNPTAVPIIIFQDELEVCNPLGAGKSRHKIQCTYYTTLDVVPALRTKVKSVQLVSLVLSKHWKTYGNEACNRPLVDDLKDLEVNGIEVNNPSKKVVKAGLALIVGDNLGQHQLGEFSASFSSGFICRVCNATYEDVCKNHHIYSECVEGYKTELLTRAQYDKFAELATENGPSAESMGIRGRCIFNELASFHCVDQLAPCVGHDYFEE